MQGDKVSDPDGFQRYERELLEQGFEVVLERAWEAGTVVDTHSHPFDAKARVVQGDLWLRDHLTSDGITRHLRPGDGFELAAGTPHSERYGPEGATYWVGRRDRTKPAT